MAKKDFIKENIVGRGDSHKKLLRHYLRVALSALVFGVLAALAFAFAAPRFQTLFSPESKPPETVTLVTAETDAAEPTVPQTEAESTEAIEDVVQTEMEKYEFSVADYNAMIADLSEIAAGAEASLVEVCSVPSGTDFLGDPLETSDVYAGLVIATTADEILVLTSEQAVLNADSIQVKLRSGTSVQGQLKGVDHTDGMAVVALGVPTLLQMELDQIQSIPLGSSSQLRQGDALIAIGAPAGIMRSTSYGFVSYIAPNTAAVDSSCRVFVSDVPGNVRMGTFLLNTRGQLVGWISSKFGQGESDAYVRIAGISDFRNRIEKLSNGVLLPYFGIITQEVSRSMQNNGLPAGVYVKACEADSPAYQAGIQSGDIVYEINGAPVLGMKDYTQALDACAPGEEALVKLRRQSGDAFKEMEFQVVTATR